MIKVLKKNRQQITWMNLALNSKLTSESKYSIWKRMCVFKQQVIYLDYCERHNFRKIIAQIYVNAPSKPCCVWNQIGSINHRYGLFKFEKLLFHTRCVLHRSTISTIIGIKSESIWYSFATLMALSVEAWEAWFDRIRFIQVFF